MKPLPKGLLIGGLVLFLGAPLMGLLFTVIGMVGAFHWLGESGISDHKDLSNHISLVLYAPMGGLIGGVLGLALVVVAAILHFATKTKSPMPNP